MITSSNVFKNKAKKKGKENKKQGLSYNSINLYCVVEKDIHNLSTQSVKGIVENALATKIYAKSRKLVSG